MLTLRDDIISTRENIGKKRTKKRGQQLAVRNYLDG